MFVGTSRDDLRAFVESLMAFQYIIDRYVNNFFFLKDVPFYFTNLVEPWNGYALHNRNYVQVP